MQQKNGKSHSKHDDKLIVNGSFEDVIKASVSNIDLSKRKTKKQPKKSAKKK